MYMYICLYMYNIYIYMYIYIYILHSKKNYERLNHNPTTTKNETVNKIIKRFHKEKLISKNITKRLKIESPKSPQFYLKPKLNKGGIPGRPDVSCYLSKISEYVDYHLQSIVKGIPSYVKDKSNFLQEINNVEFFPDNSCFV